MTMPVYPGAPWMPTFDGTEGENKYEEWKEQIEGLLSTQDVNAARKVSILLKTLTGEARRQVSVLEADERDTVDKILKYLDGLYKETVPVSKIRAQFYSCTQRPEENVNSYILRLRELFCRLRRGDTAAPSDAVLREQFLMGLSEGPLSQELRVYARRYPDQDFNALREEALLLNTEYGGMKAAEITCHAVNPTFIPKLSQTSDWKRELQQEMMDNVKELMLGFFKELMNEIQPLLQAAVAAVCPRSPPPPEQRYAQPRRRYVPQNGNEWDVEGRPICRQCKQPGHIARFCRAKQPHLSGRPSAGVRVPGASRSFECGAVLSVEQTPAANTNEWAGSERLEAQQRDRGSPMVVNYMERGEHPMLRGGRAPCRW